MFMLFDHDLVCTNNVEKKNPSSNQICSHLPRRLVTNLWMDMVVECKIKTRWLGHSVA